ncbi:MAG: 2-oxoglutarate dehydrogenase E1 component [Gemmatimonadaceae bacterium]
MTSPTITSVFNDAYIAELYEAYVRDPSSVDASWRQFFGFAQSLGGGSRDGLAPSVESTVATATALRKVAGAAGLVQAIRQYGHLAVALDPLGSQPVGAAELKPEFHGITDDDLMSIPGAALSFEDETAADVVARLRSLYSSTIGFEFEHISDETEREWFRRMIEKGEMRRVLDKSEKVAALRRLTEVDGLERFLGRMYSGVKRFSIEGTDALVPMIDVAIDAGGASQVVIGMAHRGRINVLAHILGKPYATIFAEFEGKHAATNAASDTGDVKYHMGYSTERTLADGQVVRVTLVPNPSHLEVVNPVVEGTARAMQRVTGAAPGTRDEGGVLPLIVHGDAAFPGEGVVAETLNLSGLTGYRTGGTLHIIANNQVGFTTDPRDGRSTYYSSDLAKGFEVPIVHVNGDDPESCLTCVELALAYRKRFRKDFLIDLVGYRRHGHNETDEPMFTQPTIYAKVKAHPAPRAVWGVRLVQDGVVGADEPATVERDVMANFDRVHDEAKKKNDEDHGTGEHSAAAPPQPVETAVPAERVLAYNEALLSWPGEFHPLPKLAKQLERRRAALGPAGGIDWGHAEALAFASLLAEGTSVRMSGQDVERGTFSHRQVVLHDYETGFTHIPLQHVPGASGWFEIYNSPLSETAVLGFEYGYSVAAPDTLTLWEAQFGDFVNVAQPVIDQFLAADRAKWGQNSGVVLLLPHGYEGQGPEHSSARLERFLQLCAEGNLRVAYPSTPAQYFHILRRQARGVAERRPLVLMQPKSLLRLDRAASKLVDLTSGGFRPVIDDPTSRERRERVRRVAFCTGKIYYDLAQAEQTAHVAIVRVEELYPWPHEAIRAVLEQYPAAEDVIWVQEEPRNMGAWTFVAPRLRAAVPGMTPVRYAGRPERASPAEGYMQTHQEAQMRIVADVLAPMPRPAMKEPLSGPRAVR